METGARGRQHTKEVGEPPPTFIKEEFNLGSRDGPFLPLFAVPPKSHLNSFNPV